MIGNIESKAKAIFGSFKKYEIEITGKYNRYLKKRILKHIDDLNRWLSPLGLKVEIKEKHL
jgi:intein/homing endonuclease